MHTCTHGRVHVFMYARISACAHSRVCARTCVCVSVCVCVCVCDQCTRNKQTHKHAHKHEHTQTRKHANMHTQQTHKHANTRRMQLGNAAAPTYTTMVCRCTHANTNTNGYFIGEFPRSTNRVDDALCIEAEDGLAIGRIDGMQVPA